MPNTIQLLVLQTAPLNADSVHVYIPGTTNPIVGQLKTVAGANLPNPFTIAAAGGQTGWAVVLPEGVEADLYWVEGDQTIALKQGGAISPYLKGVTEVISPEVVTGAATAYAFIIDLNYNRHKVGVSALGAGDTLTISLANPKTGVGVQSVVLTFKTGADVSFTVVPPSGMGFTALTADVRTKVVQETEDDGVVWDESVVGEFT